MVLHVILDINFAHDGKSFYHDRITLLQAFIDHGVSESPETVVAMMQEVTFCTRPPSEFCSELITEAVFIVMTLYCEM